VQQLEEYSQAVEEERDYFGEQLKEMQNEVDVERQKRDELTLRLMQLQSKVSSFVCLLCLLLRFEVIVVFEIACGSIYEYRNTPRQRSG
jgi:hypothetical protein